MKMTLSNKNKPDITIVQGEESHKGKPICKAALLMESRITLIHDVISNTIEDNPLTTVVEFQLLLPRANSAHLKRLTIKNNNTFKLFIKYLTADVESVHVGISDKFSNAFRFIARKKYVAGRQPYYAYSVAVLVNNHIFRTLTSGNIYGRSLLTRITEAWRVASGASRRDVRAIFEKQKLSYLILDSKGRIKGNSYIGIHERLSVYASIRGGSHSFEDESFCYSDNKQA